LEVDLHLEKAYSRGRAKKRGVCLRVIREGRGRNHVSQKMDLAGALDHKTRGKMGLGKGKTANQTRESKRGGPTVSRNLKSRSKKEGFRNAKREGLK